MQVRPHSFPDGLRWMRQSWQFYRRRAPLLIGLGLGFLFAQSAVLMLALLLMVPDMLVGLPRALLLPFLCLALLTLCREADLGRRADAARLMHTLQGTWPMVSAGFLFFLATELLVQLILAPHRENWEIVLNAVANEQPLPLQPMLEIIYASIRLFFATLPVVLLFAALPPLMGWHRFSTGKALFFATAALLRNWSALLVLLILFGLCIGGGMFLLTFLANVGLPPALISLVFFFGFCVPFGIATYHTAIQAIFPAPNGGNTRHG